MDYGVDIEIREIRYCVIVYDEGEIGRGGIDRVYGYRYIINRASTISANMAFPLEVEDSFLVGLREFNDLIGGGKVLEFDVKLGVIASVPPNLYDNFGMMIGYPSPRVPYVQLSQQIFTIFFIARYRCPIFYYFNDVSQMCEECGYLFQCLNCLNISYCRICFDNFDVN